MLKMFFSILLSIFPSFINVPIRRLLGQKIGCHSKIRIGTILTCKEVEIGNHTEIGPFVFVNSISLKTGDHCRIKPFSIFRTNLLQLGSYSQFSPLVVVNGHLANSSRLVIGEHSRIFPFCWIEPGEGVEIGSHVGVGGHSFIFTHGAWSDYLIGGRVSYGPVQLLDRVWLPWRVTVLPGVTVGADSVIMSGSVVSKSIEENSLAMGGPAKSVAEGIKSLSDMERLERANDILEDFSRFLNESQTSHKSKVSKNQLLWEKTISIDSKTHLKHGDILFLVNGNLTEEVLSLAKSKKFCILHHSTHRLIINGEPQFAHRFCAFVRRYGIRLSILEISQVE
jgi:acetyltransferase-like isoleucine patch superfamily enzyme